LEPNAILRSPSLSIIVNEITMKQSILTVFAFLIFCVPTPPAHAQTFDEDFHLWPVDLKINGTIIAIGGGKIPSELDEVILRYAGDDEAKIVTLNFGSEADHPPMNALKELEVGAKLIEIFILDSGKAKKETAIPAIQKATCVIINAEQLTPENQAWLDSTIPHLKALLDRKGVLVTNGMSTQFLGKISSGQIHNNIEKETSSNLIPDSLVLTNYNDDRDRKNMLSKLAANPRNVGIGIPGDTAIILRGRKIRVVGAGAVTFVLMANEQKPLRIQHVKQANSPRANPYEYIIDLTAWRRDAIERTVAPFPVDQPETPHVENGTLIIVGGGGMPNGLMNKMVELAGGKDAHMVYVPCTEADEVSPQQRTVEAWKKMGVASATTFHTKDRNKANSDEEFLEPLKNATGIWFGGGRQWNMADSYYGTKAHRLMKEVLHRGGVIGGSSAGASIQGRYMCRANPVANYDIMAPGYERGLGFLSGVAIDQHFTQRGRQKDMTQLANRYPQLLGIGLDEATAIIVKKSVAEVTGKGKVFFYDRNKFPFIPGEEDYIALESGEVFDLAKREVIETVPMEED